ncbi:MAG: AAA family ATPase [Nitrobacter sp.]
MSTPPKDFELIKMPSKFQHDQPGLYSLKNLPQRQSISDSCMDTGWWEMDQIFKFYPGQFVICTGLPGHGKSTFVLNMLVNLAKKRGARSFMFVPENEAHLRDKLKRIWGDDDGFEYFCSDQCFVQSAVYESHDAHPQTLDWVLAEAVIAIQKSSVDFLLIDPWNELEWAKAKDQTMTEYIAESLKLLKFFARKHSVTIIVVAHPTKARVAGSGPVTLADIEGSMHWYNKCDNGLIVEREKGGNTAKVVSAKVREQGAGKVGSCYFYVDPESERFTPQHGGVDAF